MNFLRQTDARLTELEFSSEVDARERMEGLRGLRRSMAAREGQLEQVWINIIKYLSINNYYNIHIHRLVRRACTLCRGAS